MAIGSVVLGILNIAIVVVLLLLLGAGCVWLLQLIAGITIPGNIQQLYLILVALIAIYMVAALIFGLPTIRILGGP